MTTNLGKWDRWYSLDPEDSRPYGDVRTYELGAEFLADCLLVEDWGCGRGWMRQFVPITRYRGLDGSASYFADRVVDLATYRSSVPGIFMRHVIEHDYRWQQILDNAVASFTERMVLVLFTPLVLRTQEIAFNEDPGVPDIAFSLRELVERFGDGVAWHAETLKSDTQYEQETIIYLERKAA